MQKIKHFLIVSFCLFSVNICLPKTHYVIPKTVDNLNRAVDKIETTQYFEFHNNFWINLHFYLYEMASMPGKSPKDIIEKNIWQRLSHSEKETFQKTVNYYKTSIDLKNHFSQELIGLRKWLINYGERDRLPETKFEASFIQQLNEIKPVYLKYFWDIHRQINLEKLKENIDLIKKTESIVIPEISKLAQAEWQDNKMRIDLSVRSPGGGAFTLVRAPGSIVLGTVVNYNQIAGDWVETLFHEASHTVVKRQRGAVAESISRTSKKLAVESPRNLWHAILFYMAGKVSQKAFKVNGIQNYTLYMDREKEFSFYQEAIYQYFTPYIDQETDLDSALELVIRSIVNKKTLGNTITIFNEAYKVCDVNKLESMITDDYIHTNGSSKPIGRNAWLAYIKKRKKDIENGHLIVNNYEMQETQLKLYDDFAIFTAKIIVKATRAGKPEENQFRVTHIWVKENNIWKRSGFHDSRITN